ncbi:protein takeout-like [Prorops nasuta]|uniref:protein takeout-like n=1 Tax=Prorops nasuta TaxID=863751 RepID=UPI0034CD1827
MNLVQLVTFAVSILAYSVFSRNTPEIPPFLQICYRDDPNLNECVKDSVNALKPYLKDGIPALHIPPCEPLNIPKIDISQAAGPVSVSSTYTNIKVSGGTDFILKTVKVNVEKDRTKLKLKIPRLNMTADYIMDGRILMLPVTGNGIVHGNFTDIDAIVRIQGERYEDAKTEMTHLRVTDFYVDFNVGRANIHLDNLFNGDKTLSEAMNLFLNDNWKTVAAEIKPALEETVATLFKKFCNRIYSKYPLDVLLPRYS